MESLSSLLRRRLGRPESAFGATTRFAIVGFIALAVASGVTAFALSRFSNEEAIRDARTLTRVLGEGAVEPQLSDRLVAGDRAAIAGMDRVVRERVLKDPVARVKLWTADGRIVYSDEHRLIGSRYDLEEDKRAAFEEGGVFAHKVSKLDEPENRFDRGLGEVLEVYLPVETPNGTTLLLETYQRLGSVSESGRDIWLTFAPGALAALALLWLAQLPLAWSLARRLEAGRSEREALLRRAIEASDIERRRIAADLHDSVVQDLAGISFALAATADRLEAGAGNGAAGAVRQAAADTRESVRQLRSLLVEIHPPNLHNVGLANALSDLVAPLAASGLSVRVEIPEDLTLEPHVEALVYRVAREALRNVQTHADARTATVSLDVEDGRVLLRVADDGRGFSAGELIERGAKGHMGIALLTQLVTERGGTLAVESQPARGTSVRMEMPA